MEEGQLKQYKIDITSFTNKGQREANEDRFYHTQIDENTYLLLLADGMGGYLNGDLAAEIAIETITKVIQTRNELPIEQNIELAFKNANRLINQRINNAGTTIGGVLITEENIYLFWAGDVKIALFNDSKFFISKEHNLLNVLRDAKIIIKQDEITRLTHTVVRSLGVDSKAYTPEIMKFKKGVFKGILYTDGMASYYSEDELFSFFAYCSRDEVLRKFKPSNFDDSTDNVTGLVFWHGCN